MTRLLDDLPDLDSRLLMYAAGELSPEDAQAVERELAEEPERGSRLEELRALLGSAEEALATLDAADPLAGRAVLRASARAQRALAEWTADREPMRLRPELLSTQGVVWRYARWPLAAAAMLVAGIVLFSYYVGEPGGTQGTLAVNQPTLEMNVGPIEQGTTIAQSEQALQRVAAMFDSPADWGDGDGLVQLDLGSDLTSELARLRQLDPEQWD